MKMQVSPSAIANSDIVNLSATLLDRDAELTNLLEKVSSKKTQGWLQEIRDNAANWVRHSVIPTTREEEWRFTDLSALRQVEFVVGTQSPVSGDDIPSLVEANTRLVFVNGVYAPQLSTTTNLPDGVVVSNLAGLPSGCTEKIQQYLTQSEGALEVFTALNTAGINDAAVVWIPQNVVVETLIHLVFMTAGGETTISQPRCLVVAETGSQVSLVEEYTNHKDTEGVYFTNAVTEIFVNENAQVNHTRVESDGREAFHIGKTAVTQARYSRYSCHAINLGGKISRHNLEILQTGEQTETTLNGLTVIGNQQVGDTHSAIALNHPYGITRQLHKCIVADKAHGVFNGKVFVPKPAQLTDAGQLNRNLLLSPQARVDTKPQLEITADNVKCAHGATVSQLEDDQIFYLQSRGIDEDSARNLLIHAFAAEIINYIPIPSLRERLTQTVSPSTSLRVNQF
jgi:Fe-S cluster assembly protein SufD